MTGPIDEITRALSDADDRVYAVVREMQKQISSLTESKDAGWAIAKARAEEIVKLTEERDRLKAELHESRELHEDTKDSAPPEGSASDERKGSEPSGASGFDERARFDNFHNTCGALSWNRRSAAEHPDRCKCQGVESTPHKHYAYPPYSCARCANCDGYTPAVEPSGAIAEGKGTP